MSRPISEINLSEVLHYEETINGVTSTVAYWPLWKESDGVVLLRALALDTWREMNNTNDATYIGCVMDNWLEDDTDGYLSYFDAKMRACIIPATIKVKPYGSDTVTEIARRAFLLSESNIIAAGGDEGDSILPVLKTHTGETNDNNARKAYNSAGVAVYWWLRTAGSVEQFWRVNTSGIIYSSNATSNYSPRPAFKVSNDTMVSDATEDTIYILPDASKLYRELSFTAVVGETENRPMKAKVQVSITNATESTIQASNNAKDETPVWVDCTADQVVELSNATKTSDKWALGVKVYAKSEGKATCSEPVVIVEVEE